MQSAAPDRLRLLLRVFATAGRTGDGRPTTEQLRGLTGVSASTLSPKYRSDLTDETIRLLSDSCAQLLLDAHIFNVAQAAKLTPWLEGVEDPELEALLTLESRLVKCTGSEDIPCADSTVLGLRARWFDPEHDDARKGGPWERRLRMCQRHVRAAQTPQTAVWEEQIARDLPRAPLVPVIEARLRERSPGEPAHKVAAEAQRRRDQIVNTFQRMRKAYQAVIYARWAQQAELDRKELRRTLSRAGLPEKPREGKKHFGRFAEFLVAFYTTWHLLGGHPAQATEHLSEFRRYGRFAADAWLRRFRRWLAADRLRHWLASLLQLAGRPPRPALGVA